MILPELLTSRNYRTTLPALKGSHLILDNGMFEGQISDPEELCSLAISTGATEIVMPDMREDMEGTLKEVSKFLDVFELTHFPYGQPQLMIVVQIGNLEQIPWFISQAIHLEGRYFGGHKFTYGIPRRLAEKFGPETRIHIVDWLRDMSPTSDVHLLGYVRTGLNATVFNEVLALRQRVRSIDTDAPYVWAQRNESLVNGKRIERPKRYFGMLPEQFPENALVHNIRTLEGWAHA
jgi:hypothetical protein